MNAHGRGIFIHHCVVTVVILIGIGVEQVAEYIHYCHQLNLAVFRTQHADFDRFVPLSIAQFGCAYLSPRSSWHVAQQLYAEFSWYPGFPN